MATGVVKSYDEQRMFGVIQPDEGGKAVFFHSSVYAGAGKELEAGDRVEYTLGSAAAMPKAESVKRL